VEPVRDVPVAAPQAAEARTSVTESDVVFDAPAKSTAADVDLLVAEARLARDAGQIFNPAGNNAIELYAAAVAASPENAVIATELNTVLEQALAMAETGLLESRFDDVAAALERGGAVAPGNVRLPFLTAQLKQAQLRSHVSDARSAIREERFEDAGRAIAAARALGVASATEIDALTDELQKARSEQKVDEVLALANARLEEGHLVSPANDNARYYFGLVLSNDPQNVAALQGMNVVASKLVLQARSEIDQGNLNDAEDILAAARALDSSNTELAAAEVALLSARDALAAEQRAAEARRRAAEQQAAADRKAQADAEAAAQREAETVAAREADAASAAVAEPVVAPASEAAATVAGKPGASESVVSANAAEPGEVATERTAVAATPEPAADEPIDVRDQEPVSISSLNRVKYVSPKYPRAAQRRNQSGWVDVVFTVSLEGTVTDLVVRDSEPGDLFVDAALKAVEQWEFEPIVEDGQVVEKRAGVRMMFALE
jgi:protein TonB